MLMSEIVDQVSFSLGMPANANVEGVQIETAVLMAFRELKEFMKTPTHATVPYSSRIDLLKHDIHATQILYVFPAQPKVGLTQANPNGSNVFALAASAKTSRNAWNGVGGLDPIVEQLAMAQAFNTLSTDFQTTVDIDNQVIYCTCKPPIPAQVTIRYVADYQDVSEIKKPAWINYLIRLSTANMKECFGQSRSKYTIDGSNVKLNGELLLQQAADEFTKIREELSGKKKRLVVVR